MINITVTGRIDNHQDQSRYGEEYRNRVGDPVGDFL